jgi:N-acetylglucosamine-6-phosphate deacetylase
VAVGRAADLVLVDQAWDVRATIVDGRLVYDAGAAAEAAR